VQSLRLKRPNFLKFWNNLKPVHVVMEACGSAHHFGRWLTSMGHRISLLPAQYVRAYVRRNKTDAADCADRDDGPRLISCREAEKYEKQAYFRAFPQN
jgi:transposase